jgi:hypothetical protein
MGACKKGSIFFGGGFEDCGWCSRSMNASRFVALGDLAVVSLAQGFQ